MSDIFSDLLRAEESKKEPPCHCVVRLTTSYWHDADGIHMKKSLRYLKRKCVGYNILYEDAHMIGASETMPRITNLDECEDGIYEVVTCNEWAAWETPHIIEDYDYKLIPYEPSKESETKTSKLECPREQLPPVS